MPDFQLNPLKLNSYFRFGIARVLNTVNPEKKSYMIFQPRSGPQWVCRMDVQILTKKSANNFTQNSALRGSKRVNRCLLATFFFFWSTVADDESRVTTIFQGCPVSVLLVGEVLNCLNRKKKSYFFLSDRRFLNLLNHKKKILLRILGRKKQKIL